MVRVGISILAIFVITNHAEAFRPLNLVSSLPSGSEVSKLERVIRPLVEKPLLKCTANKPLTLTFSLPIK